MYIGLHFYGLEQFQCILINTVTDQGLDYLLKEHSFKILIIS